MRVELCLVQFLWPKGCISFNKDCMAALHFGEISDKGNNSIFAKEDILNLPLDSSQVAVITSYSG